MAKIVENEIDWLCENWYNFPDLILTELFDEIEKGNYIIGVADFIRFFVLRKYLFCYGKQTAQR